MFELVLLTFLTVVLITFKSFIFEILKIKFPIIGFLLNNVNLLNFFLLLLILIFLFRFVYLLEIILKLFRVLVIFRSSLYYFDLL